MAEKMRVHILAKEMNVSSKAILEKCSAEGLPVKNHMTALGPGLEATIREWFTEGSHATTLETADRVDLKKVRVRKRRKSASSESADVAQSAVAVEEPSGETDVADDATMDSYTSGGGESSFDDAETVSTEQAAGVAVAEAPESATGGVDDMQAAVAEASSGAGATVDEQTAAPESATDTARKAKPAKRPKATKAATEATPVGESPDETAADDAEATETDDDKQPLSPAGPQNVPAPAQLKGPRVVRYEAPEQVAYPTPRSGRSSRSRPAAADADVGPVASTDRGGRRGGAAAGETVSGKKSRRSGSPRRTSRGSEIQTQEKLKEWRDQDLLERKERLAGATGRKIHSRRAIESQGAPGLAPGERKGKVQLREPVRVKEYCATVGTPFLKVMRRLQQEHEILVNINTTISNEVAELLALEDGVELEIIRAKTQLDLLREEFEERKPNKLGPRPPVVTFLGHVDHGKTSLMDAIRRARVASGEDGGITQHIGSYHYERDNVRVTFLDTPGHAAFTAMRARGAQLTDIVVLIVAADDGIMPQTVEAINHAKAAKVPIVVAITKIDLGNFEEHRVYGELSEKGLVPSGDWGGDVDVIKTSSVTGQGIDELLEHLTALGEVLDLKADHAGDPYGTVIEAETQEGVGAVARVLVQSGKLKPGATVVCGNAFGKVRALIDDRGNRLQEAGPSMPCEIWGLDEVPSAGDQFYGLSSSQRAKSIAEEVRHKRLSSARIQVQKARSLEDVFKQRTADEVTPLNLIIRADVDGSVDAIRHSLDKLPSDQVQLDIRHAGVGAVTDSDVQLADASNAVIVGFRVAPTQSTRRQADEMGVEIREYKVIYELIDDITKAMEGLLAPEEKLELRATIEVREVFKITKVGAVAGCYVTDGTVHRDHQLRLLREGVVVRDTCKLASLKRFKDDAKEVRAGMECGIRLEGFDDIKQGDVLEAYEVVKVARKL